MAALHTLRSNRAAVNLSHKITNLHVWLALAYMTHSSQPYAEQFIQILLCWQLVLLHCSSPDNLRSIGTKRTCVVKIKRPSKIHAAKQAYLPETDLRRAQACIKLFKLVACTGSRSMPPKSPSLSPSSSEFSNRVSNFWAVSAPNFLAKRWNCGASCLT